jgi:hypothetical protein
MVRDQRDTVFYTSREGSVYKIHRVKHHNVMMERV